MARWEVEYTDEFGDWWDRLTEAEQESIDASVRLLEERGPQLPHPHSSAIGRSKHPHLRELRVQHRGRPYRVLYAFDPRRTRFCSSAGTRRATIAGTTSMCRTPTGFMTSIWLH